ncbi:unnamed protein product, partial [Musa acuminata subsp. burmannicoides]
RESLLPFRPRCRRLCLSSWRSLPQRKENSSLRCSRYCDQEIWEKPCREILSAFRLFRRRNPLTVMATGTAIRYGK